MPFFVSAKERDRLLADIDEARERARVAEARLFKANLAMLDLAAKKLGAHAISPQVEPPEPEKPMTEAQFRESLKDHHLWPFYLQSAMDVGKGEEEALDALTALVKGEPLPFQQTM